jgi:hypothetical protein
MIILGTREAGVKIGTPKSGVPRARSLQLARMRLCHVHSFFTNMSLAVALLMLGWAIFALLGLLSSAVFRWRAAQTQWPFRNPEVLALIWFYSFDVSRGDYFSAIFYAIFFGWIFRRSKVKNPLTLSQLGAEATLLGAVGVGGVLVYFDLLQRILGPVGAFLLRPLVLLTVSFAILLLLVWRGFRATNPLRRLNHASSCFTYTARSDSP